MDRQCCRCGQSQWADHVYEVGDWKTDWKNIVSAYVPHVGLSIEEKDDFWDSFIIVLSRIPKQDSIFIGSNLNGHVGRDADVHMGVWDLVQETLKARGL